jgi:hypothetical protein
MPIPQTASGDIEEMILSRPTAFTEDEASIANTPIDDKSYPRILLKMQRLPFIGI